MGFLLIGEGGQLTYETTRPSHSALSRCLGPHGIARVRLSQTRDMCGYVSDCGLIMPDTYRRNPVGTCVLASFGANAQPYAGPVALVGWEDRPEPDLVDLPQRMGQTVTDIHVAVSAVLSGLASGYGAQWDREIAEVAELALTVEAPAIQVIPYYQYRRRLDDNGPQTT